MTVQLQSEDELRKLASDLVLTLYRLRKAQKSWEEHYGCERKNYKKLNEERADALISKFNIGVLNANENINFEIIN